MRKKRERKQHPRHNAGRLLFVRCLWALASLTYKSPIQFSATLNPLTIKVSEPTHQAPKCPALVDAADFLLIDSPGWPPIVQDGRQLSRMAAIQRIHESPDSDSQTPIPQQLQVIAVSREIRYSFAVRFHPLRS